MQRLLAIIAATAAAAAVAAAISLPAGAAKSGSDELATFASCLRAHGAAIPTGLDAVATKEWLGAHEQEADVSKAMDACNPVTVRREKTGNTASPAELVSCLHDHGLEAPATIDELKPWVARQMDTAAGKAVLNACGLDTAPADKRAGGGPDGCGVDKAGHAAATTSKARAARARTTPAQ
jgi:hypothetical protein